MGKAATGPRTVHAMAIDVWQRIVLSLRTFYCVAHAHSIVWQTHTFYCLSDAHSIVRQTHILLFGRRTFYCVADAHERGGLRQDLVIH